MTRIGILGGTLDPIHCGHIGAAVAARDALNLSRVLVVPSHVPPHRAVRPVASAYHRFAMAALAVSSEARLEANDDELLTGGPSFTADTLERLHAKGIAASQIFFITGADAFAEIATWKRYPEVLNLAHFVVVSRPGHSLSVTERFPALADRIVRPGDLVHDGSQPLIYSIAASTPDISSTAVRDRLKRGESIIGLVPPLVETHIVKHRLYRAEQLHGEI
ncbi:MAG TPA: nicotinate-nucleotide adenylyltransferase [Vicinamibacterales bacterium]|jgi:nicotinate-nucleotide adenylyltransferase|nr:nicotinate-nucleotide adenylyltransferase [Vicinamibacterales bacterium]